MLFSVIKVIGIAAFAFSSPVFGQLSQGAGACSLDIQSNVEPINVQQNLFRIKVDNMSPQKGTPDYVELHYVVTNPLSSSADTQSMNVRVADNWKANPAAAVASDSIAIPQANVLSWYLTYSTDRVQQCDTPIQSFKNGALSAQQEQNALNAAWRTLVPLASSPVQLQQQAVRAAATSPVITATPLNLRPIQQQATMQSNIAATPSLQQQPIQSMSQFASISSLRASLPVQQAVTSAIQSNDPIMKLQAVRDHYNELLTQSTDATLKEQGRTLVAFLDNLIVSANLRQQQIRAQQTATMPTAPLTQQPVLSPSVAPITTPISSVRPLIQQPIMGSTFQAPVAASRSSVGIFQSSYSSQSAVCANIALDSSIEKNAPQTFNVKIKPLESMEFIDVHLQFNDDPLQQVHVRASPAEGVSANQELHLPLQLDANQKNVKYYLTSKAMNKGYQCDTPMFSFNA